MPVYTLIGHADEYHRLSGNDWLHVEWTMEMPDRRSAIRRAQYDDSYWGWTAGKLAGAPFALRIWRRGEKPPREGIKSTQGGGVAVELAACVAGIARKVAA